MRRFLFLLLPVLIATGCNNKNTFTVEGNTVKNESDTVTKQNKYIFLSKIDVDTPLLIDSAKVKQNGRFRFKVRSSQFRSFTT